MHRIFNTNSECFKGSFVLKSDEKSSLTSGFQCDLIIIQYIGLRLWVTMYMYMRITVQVSAEVCHK